MFVEVKAVDSLFSKCFGFFLERFNYTEVSHYTYHLFCDCRGSVDVQRIIFGFMRMVVADRIVLNGGCAIFPCGQGSLRDGK